MSMLCCFDTTKPNYSSAATDEHSSHDEHQRPRDSPTAYPGASLRPSLSGDPPADTVLIRTGGNALQAVDQRALETEHVISVIIPEGIKPGQTILVAVPDGSGRFVSAVVPNDCFPGHNFLVKAEPPVVVTGIPVNEAEIPVVQALCEGTDDLFLSEEADATHTDDAQEIEMSHQTAQNEGGNTDSRQPQQDRVLIQVPSGVAPGSKIRVKLSDGRTVDVVVPPGEVSQFFVLVPRRHQNWHDSPMTYAAPMVVAPLLL